MRYGFPDLRQGFEVEADVVIIGSGAGGAVAALNLAEGGMRTVVLEAGPELRPEMMDKDAPRFMARYYWEGGLRAIGGSAQIPSLQGRCLGGSTVVNSAIMLRLPDWVREEWASGHHLEFLRGPGLEESYARIEARCHVTPTPEAVQGRRNRVTRAALAAVGMPGGPLPRAVKDCQGCADCLTGCAGGHKQSTDRSYLPDAERHGAQVYCSAEVERILVEGGRAVGVTGRVVDPLTKEVHRRFTVRAKRVVVAAGAAHTPVLLLESGLNPGGLVGATFHAHLGGGIIGMMEEPTDPFVGATQGWGAISSEIKGLKYEGLWAAQGLLLMRWGGLGAKFLERLHEIRHTAVIAQVYRAKVKGSVQRGIFGGPKMRLQIPRDEARVFVRGIRTAADALLKVGARFVMTGIHGAPEELRSFEESARLLDLDVAPSHLPMTANHIFGSVPMSGDPRLGPVDPDGRLRGVEGVWVADASLFPSGSAVNPQATIMALSDLVTRKMLHRTIPTG